MKYHAFDVGPVTATARVREGEASVEAVARAKAVALSAWQAEYREKLDGHFRRVAEAADAARGGR